MTKKERLNDIVKSCEIRFKRGDINSWKHGDFVDLNREMLHDTGANISPNTLKRIFGKISVDEDYIPQQATLDALKQYGKYIEPENLPAEFPATTQSKPDMPAEVQADVEVADAAKTAPPDKKSTFKSPWFISFIFIVAFAVAGLALQLLKPQNITGKIKVTSTEGNSPATAFFELDVPKTDDSFFVNFGDKSPLTYITPGEKKSAHIYYFPGVFPVSVQYRGHTIANTTAYIKSDGWISFAFHNQQEIPDHYYLFPAVKQNSDSLFQVTNPQLYKMGLDTAGVVLTRLCNYAPVNHKSDDFIFEATFKNSSQEKYNYCRSTQFQISGSNSFIKLKLVSPGCSQRVYIAVSEQIFSGATNNLSQFVVDPGSWNTVKLVNNNKQLAVYINNKLFFTQSYKVSLGDIRGLFLEFEGPGVVKNCDLKSFGGTTLYHF